MITSEIEIDQKAINQMKMCDAAYFHGRNDAIISIGEELELMRRARKVRTKKQLIDHMQKFIGKIRSRKP